MRIISLLPAATEWVAALGAASELVGRSHECDYPPEVRDLPEVTRSCLDDDSGTKAIEDQVQRALHSNASALQQGLSLYEVDFDVLRALEPDLVLTQAQCEVCAVSYSQLEDALSQWTERRPRLFSLQPMTFKQVLDAALRLGRTLGRMEEAMHLIAEEERNLRRLHERLDLGRTSTTDRLPTVACIEWLDPLMTAGHWMPDVAELAGGRAVLAEKGVPSRRVTWDALRQADPDVIAIMPCGFTLDETARDLSYLTRRDGWADLRAVRERRVYLFDGNAYFNRPGPRLYRATQLLASVLYPGRLEAGLAVQSWEQCPLRSASIEKAS